MLVTFCFGFSLVVVGFCFLLILPHPIKSSATQRQERALRNTGSLCTHSYFLLHLSQPLSLVPISKSEGKGGVREKFLVAPRGTASRPGAPNDLCPHSQACASTAPRGQRDAGRMQAFPCLAFCSWTPGCRSLELGSEGSISTLTSPVRM